MNNLIENMLKYSTEDTVSEIIVEEDMIIFENTGLHDPTVNGTSIFMKGFRGSLAKDGDGMGWGLHYAREMAHAVGFDIEFYQLEPTSVANTSLYRFVVSQQ